jgi:hypothetical protein
MKKILFKLPGELLRPRLERLEVPILGRSWVSEIIIKVLKINSQRVNCLSINHKQNVL